MACSSQQAPSMDGYQTDKVEKGLIAGYADAPTWAERNCPARFEDGAQPNGMLHNLRRDRDSTTYG